MIQSTRYDAMMRACMYVVPSWYACETSISRTAVLLRRGSCYMRDVKPKYIRKSKPWLGSKWKWAVVHVWRMQCEGKWCRSVKRTCFVLPGTRFGLFIFFLQVRWWWCWCSTVLLTFVIQPYLMSERSTTELECCITAVVHQVLVVPGRMVDGQRRKYSTKYISNGCFFL